MAITEEIKLKFYSHELQAGYNDWRKVYDTNLNVWVDVEYHLGRLVYGKQRKSFTKLRQSKKVKDFVAVEYLPF
jgi:hypothetical protein